MKEELNIGFKIEVGEFTVEFCDYQPEAVVYISKPGSDLHGEDKESLAFWVEELDEICLNWLRKRGVKICV